MQNFSDSFLHRQLMACISSGGTLQLLFKRVDFEASIVEIGADELIFSASLMKLLISVVVLEHAKKDPLFLTRPVPFKTSPETQGTGFLQFLNPVVSPLKLNVGILHSLMLAYSDNVASNHLIDLLGKESINEAAKRHGLTRTVLRNHFYDPAIIHTTPNFDTWNVTSARDTDKMLALLSTQPEAMRVLAQQALREGIPAIFDADPTSEWHVFNKTGTLNYREYDAALLTRNNQTYSLVICVSDLESAKAKALIRCLTTLIKQSVEQGHC